MSTVAWITARGLLGRRRFLLLFPLPILLVGLAALSRGFGVTSSEWGPAVIYGLGFAVVLPVVALIVGTGVLGAEIDDGTIVHILSKPLPRWRIILPKLLVATAVTAVTVAVPLYIVGVLAEGVRLGLALVVGLGGRRAGVLGHLPGAEPGDPAAGAARPGLRADLGGAARQHRQPGPGSLSVQQYVVTIADWIAATPLLDASCRPGHAVVMSVVVTVGFTWLAIDRLRSFSVAGETG